MSETYGTFEVVNIEAKAESIKTHESYAAPTSIISCSSNNNDNICIDSENNFNPVEIENNQYTVIEIGKTSSRKSNSLWNYFGLAAKENSILSSALHNDKDEKNNRKYSPSIQDRILCLLCYNNNIIHVYMKSTASGNLWRHLSKVHGISTPKSNKLPRKPLKIRKTKLIQNLLNSDQNNLNSNETQTETENNNTLYHNSIITAINDVNDNENDYISTENLDDKQKINSSESDSNNILNSINYVNTQDIGSILIEEVAKRPDLYILSHNNSKKTLRNQLWQEIYESTGKIMEIEQLQKIWRNIRDRYRKLKNLEKQGLTENAHKYKYYSQLKFLDSDIITDDSQDDIKDPLHESSPYKNKLFSISLHDTQIDDDQSDSLTKRIKIDNNEMVEEIINSYNDQEEYLENIQIQQQQQQRQQQQQQQQQHIDFENNNENVITTINSNKNNINTNSEQLISSSVLSSLKLCNCDCNRQDEFDIFGKFIAQKLRKYPKSKSNNIEIKILQLFNDDEN